MLDTRWMQWGILRKTVLAPVLPQTSKGTSPYQVWLARCRVKGVDSHILIESMPTESI